MKMNAEQIKQRTQALLVELMEEANPTNLDELVEVLQAVKEQVDNSVALMLMRKR